jgi:UDP-2-acetamido-3-amino-2,3-dideoxy-glucuronate N-acetyltransferase
MFLNAHQFLETMKSSFIHETAVVSQDAKIGSESSIWNQVQVREHATIGDNVILSKNVYVDAGVYIGNNCKVQNNVSIYHGVTLEDGVFVGPHVCFTNDKIPRAINKDGSRKNKSDWTVSKTKVCRGASIGANTTILPGITIGRFAMIAAGSIVTKDVPDFGLIVGSPGKLVGYVDHEGNKVEQPPKDITNV